MVNVKEMVREQIARTQAMIVIILCDFFVVVTILVCVWIIGYISSFLGMNAYPINILQMLSEIGLTCIFIIIVISDMISAYKIHLKP